MQEMQRHSGSGHKHGAGSPERLIVICRRHLGTTDCTYVPVRAGGCGAGAVRGGVTRSAGTRSLCGAGAEPISQLKFDQILGL